MSFIDRLKGTEDITHDYMDSGWNPRVGLPVMAFIAGGVLLILSQCQKSSAHGDFVPKPTHPEQVIPNNSQIH